MDTTRRAVLQGVAAAGLVTTTRGMATTPLRIVASGLRTPESPKPQRDGSVVLVEMTRGTLTRVHPGGRAEVIATLGDMPNACAMGPDGAFYVPVNAAAVFHEAGGRSIWAGVRDPKGRSCIRRVDPRTGRHSMVYATTAQSPLVAPNDLVFDPLGHFYFTDIGAPSPRPKPGCVYFAHVDGSLIRRIADVPMANGIVLSPDGRRLRVASDKDIVEFEVLAPGRLAADDRGQPRQRVFGSIAKGTFDSMAGDATGGIVAGTLFPGGLSVFSPAGGRPDTIRIPLDPAVTNIGFGGADLRSAFVSLTQTGRLAEMDWPKSGLRLAFS